MVQSRTLAGTRDRAYVAPEGTRTYINSVFAIRSYTVANQALSTLQIFDQNGIVIDTIAPNTIVTKPVVPNQYLSAQFITPTSGQCTIDIFSYVQAAQSYSGLVALQSQIASNAPINVANGSISTGSDFTMAMLQGAAAGDALIICLFSGSTITSITDPYGQTYTLIGSSVNAGGYSSILGYNIKLITGLNVGDILTVHLGTPHQLLHAWSIFRIPNGLHSKDQSATSVQTGVASMSVGPTSPTTQALELVMAFFGAFYGNTIVAAMTPGTGFTSLTGAHIISGGNAIWLAPEYTFTSAAGQQSAGGIWSDPSLNSSAGCIATFA